MRIGLYLLIFAMVVPAVGQQLPDSVLNNAVKVPYEPKSDAFLDTYMEVVYRRSAYPDSTNRFRMRLWKEPVKVYVDPSVPVEDARALKEFARQIDGAVDSLRIEFVSSVDSSNYIVYQTNPQFNNQYEPRLSASLEGYYLYWKGAAITQGFLKIDTEAFRDTGIRKAVLLWRFYLSLGHFQPLGNPPCTAYLSQCFSSEKEISESDLEILKYHYSYGICKGTGIIEFMKQHRLARESLAQNPKNEFYFLHVQ